MLKINSINIFKAFFKIGAVLLGGGYVIVPVMKSELVEKRGWIDEVELTDFYCVSQCLPGIIAVNMALLVGFKLLNLKGAVVSLFAMALSPVITIIIIADFLNRIMKIPFVQGLFWGVNLSVIILIYLTVKEMRPASIVDKFTAAWFFVILALSLCKISPIVLILASVVLGLSVGLIKRREDE